MIYLKKMLSRKGDSEFILIKCCESEMIGELEKHFIKLIRRNI